MGADGHNAIIGVSEDFTNSEMDVDDAGEDESTQRETNDSSQDGENEHSQNHEDDLPVAYHRMHR